MRSKFINGKGEEWYLKLYYDFHPVDTFTEGLHEHILPNNKVVVAEENSKEISLVDSTGRVLAKETTHCPFKVVRKESLNSGLITINPIKGFKNRYSDSKGKIWVLGGMMTFDRVSCEKDYVLPKNFIIIQSEELGYRCPITPEAGLNIYPLYEITADQVTSLKQTGSTTINYIWKTHHLDSDTGVFSPKILPGGLGRIIILIHKDSTPVLFFGSPEGYYSGEWDVNSEVFPIKVTQNGRLDGDEFLAIPWG